MSLHTWERVDVIGVARERRRKLLDGALLVIVGLLLVLLPPLLASIQDAGEPDFIAYWSAARLLVERRNPYDPVALRAVERAIRPAREDSYGTAFASWNPPWLLALLLPVALLPYGIAVPVWMTCSALLVILSTVLAWRAIARSKDWHGIALASSFLLWSGPSLSMLVTGQVSGLILLGFVLGAWWLQRGRERLAGAALTLTTIKPHVSYLVLLLLLIWSVRQRRFRVLEGMVVTSLSLLALVTLLFPGWPGAYYRLVTTHRGLLLQYTTPTVGAVARALWQTDALRLASIALLPLVPRLLRVVHVHGWYVAINVALLLSLPLAPYGYNSDQVVLLPVLVHIISWLWSREYGQNDGLMVIGGVVVICGASLLMLLVPLVQYGHWFVLIPLALAVLYAIAARLRERTESPPV